MWVRCVKTASGVREGKKYLAQAVRGLNEEFRFLLWDDYGEWNTYRVEYFEPWSENVDTTSASL